MNTLGETRNELIELAQANGYTVRTTQFTAWHRFGILPKRTRVALGKGHGTRSVYPIGTGKQLLALCRIHQTEKRLNHVAWHLWWVGYDVDLKRIRTFLERVALQFERAQRELVDESTGELSPSARKYIENAASLRLKGSLAHARKRIGKQRFETFLTVIFEVFTGRFEGLHMDTEEAEYEQNILEQGLGLQRARKDYVDAIEPWLPAQWVERTLKPLSQFLGQRQWTSKLTILSDAELVQARNELRPVLELIAQGVPTVVQLLGNGAFGLGALSEALTTIDAQTEAIVLLMWAILRFQQPHALPGVKPINEINSELLNGLNVGRRLTQMTHALPDLGNILSPRKFTAALKKPQHMQRLFIQLHQFYQEHTEQVEEFLKGHSEYSYEEERSSARLKLQRG